MPANAHITRRRPDTRLPLPAGQHLLPLLSDPTHAHRMQLADWDSTLRLARQARVLGMLAHRLQAAHSGRSKQAEQAGAEHWRAIPERVRGHLQAAINYSAYRAHLVRMELRDLERALPAELPVTLLKGAAYLLQDLPLTRGRAPNDVDLLVTRANLDRAEAALKTAGWQMTTHSDYDEHYYRAWSHELPPLRYPGHPLEVDLHHTITPVTSRTRADAALLFADLRPIPGSRFLALSPADQIIHAVIHLFQDSELEGELRGLVDIDALLRTHLRTDHDWQALIERAHHHQASHLLWYALHYCRRWLQTPMPEDLVQSTNKVQGTHKAQGNHNRTLAPPPCIARAALDWTLTRIFLPRLPETPPTLAQRLATQAGKVRYHLRRMPLALLARHLVHKSRVALTPSTRQSAD
ncbi:MAG: nucleotidyltransferase family protein [Lamprobacter sp.]|uniref:nucleotidyltransferase domain-containing protein n=1 Tax=Lamprobacter sp. TaxID=3100796 RepID=UPI002B25D38E|nr:nucleotidyltransferase family protein [Lamprobacter sp.]MEA3639835.1 nucleotidyltransferase family protein [Lamprobacter sp.]